MARRCEQLLRYLALVALNDGDLAFELGQRYLLPTIRRDIDKATTARRLSSYVATRLGIVDDEQLQTTGATITRLLERLADSGLSPLDPCRRTHLVV